MKLGGLFSGIGGFELAWQRNGGEVAWMCEIDPSARRVLEARFPGVPVYPDVSDLDPAELEPVDVVSGGSPCQGFSVAGGRAGMEHVESRLFADYVRIIDGLPGLQYAVWENVPGVLSIANDDGERTFPHVVAALVGADEPVRLDTRARWNTGLAARGCRAVSWRVVDSRHFGVPQRRRRVYACVAFGRSAEDRAFRALLAFPEGVCRDSAACRTSGQEVAGTLGGGAGSRGWAPDTDRMTFVPDVAHTLRGEGFDASEDGTGRGTPIIAFAWQAAGNNDASGSVLTDGTTPTLPKSQTLAILEPEQPASMVTPFGVRRLTPVECERLQGFPDGWTEPAGSDSARYRALGNAVTVNVPEWLFARMKDAA